MSTVAPTFEDRTMSIGRVFVRAITAIRVNPLVILGLALAIGALPGLLMVYLMGAATAQMVAGGATSGMVGVVLVSIVISMLIGALVQGALTRATVSASEGRRATFGESLAASLRVVFPLIGLSILFSIGVTLGFLLLIVPGIILLLMWAVAVPALVVEREGVRAAFSRSNELTKGARWKILGLFLVLIVCYWLLQILVGAIGMGSYDPNSGAGLTTSAVLGTVVMGTLFNAVWGTVQPSLYVELRQWKEGKSVEDLEQIFA